MEANSTCRHQELAVSVSNCSAQKEAWSCRNLQPRLCLCFRVRYGGRETPFCHRVQWYHLLDRSQVSVTKRGWGGGQAGLSAMEAGGADRSPCRLCGNQLGDDPHPPSQPPSTFPSIPSRAARWICTKALACCQCSHPLKQCILGATRTGLACSLRPRTCSCRCWTSACAPSFSPCISRIRPFAKDSWACTDIAGS